VEKKPRAIKLREDHRGNPVAGLKQKENKPYERGKDAFFPRTLLLLWGKGVERKWGGIGHLWPERRPGAAVTKGGKERCLGVGQVSSGR